LFYKLWMIAHVLLLLLVLYVLLIFLCSIMIKFIFYLESIFVWKFFFLLLNVVPVLGFCMNITYKTNINNESQKTLSPSNIQQAPRKPSSYRQDINANLNNFSPKVNYNIKTPTYVMTRYRNQWILKITLIWLHDRTVQ
jgi:hypothetical protein